MNVQSKNNKENEKREALFSLHKYWIRADLMYCNWRTAEKPLLISSLYPQIFAPLKEAPLFYDFYQQRHDDSIQYTYFVYWMAGVFCVMEGYKKLSLNYNEIDSSLNNLSKCLKNYRDCTYHFEIDVAKKIRAQKKCTKN